MNVERMLYLADQLENPTDPKLKLVKFNMSDFSKDTTNEYEVEEAIKCGTVACIGGHACILFGTPDAAISEFEAQKLLGLTPLQVNHLFYNDVLSGYKDTHYITPGQDRFNDITPSEAAAAIRRMVEEEGK